MAGPLAGPLIGAAGSLLGGLFGQSSERRAAKQARKWAIEDQAQQQNRKIEQLSLDEMDRLWEQAKNN